MRRCLRPWLQPRHSARAVSRSTFPIWGGYTRLLCAAGCAVPAGCSRAAKGGSVTAASLSGGARSPAQAEDSCFCKRTVLRAAGAQTVCRQASLYAARTAHSCAASTSMVRAHAACSASTCTSSRRPCSRDWDLCLRARRSRVAGRCRLVPRAGRAGAATWRARVGNAQWRAPQQSFQQQQQQQTAQPRQQPFLRACTQRPRPVLQHSARAEPL